jgi:hypothetical protein
LFSSYRYRLVLYIYIDPTNHEIAKHIEYLNNLYSIKSEMYIITAILTNEKVSVIHYINYNY